MSVEVHLPKQAVISERIQDSHDTFTLRLSYTDQSNFGFIPGQFNMLYLYGVGEVPISIVPHGESATSFDHTIRVVGRVTAGLSDLQPGTKVGIRGPFGQGWPVVEAKGDDLLLITGGLGSAPLISVIDHVMANRTDYGKLYILHGVKNDQDMMWQERYQEWDRDAENTVLLTADAPSDEWTWFQGNSVELLSKIEIDPSRTTAMLCGPEIMMSAAATRLRSLHLTEDRIWLSMERNMQCGIGQCGHCQTGPKFVCKEGPVFRLSDISELLQVKDI